MRTLLDGMDIPPPRPSSAPASPGYRTAASPADGMTRLLVLAACGLGGLLALGGTGWLLFGRSPAPVPVIEADSRPVRVKPDNPGGMQVVGADEAVAGPQMMAPATEVPAPQALRAQFAPPPRPAAPHGPVTVAGSVLPTPAVTTPAAATPRVAESGAAKPGAPLPPATPAVQPQPTGHVIVQLGALDTEAQGRAEWDRLTKRLPTLGARQPQFVRAEAAGHTVWRIRTGGFADTAEATAFCGQVKARGGACSLAF